MRTILKGIVILCFFTMVLTVLPLSDAKAADTELFVHKSPDFTVNVPKDWAKSDRINHPNTVLKKILDPLGHTAFAVVVEDLPEGKTYKDLSKDLIDYLQDKYRASNCQTLYEREIKLKDGTPAYELEVKWNHPMILFYTYQLIVFKDKKIMSLWVTTISQVNDQLKQIPFSLTLK